MRDKIKIEKMIKKQVEIDILLFQLSKEQALMYVESIKKDIEDSI